ncbi:MAG: glycosyltransferase family 2 protein [Rhizobiales bacterium]|nr:glycosyltransferase family 2 protein [Hyphomicrobiales bacterium]
MTSLSCTVIIPAYNAARTIADALQSVQAQSLRPTRIIVVDDGSTDETATIAGAMGAEVIRQRQQGPGNACNRALAEVDTPYVAYLDADDIWLPHKTGHQFPALAGSSPVDGVFGMVRLFHHGEEPAADAPTREGWGRTTMLFRTSVMRTVGPIYDPKAGLGDMVDWISRARESGHRLVMQPEVVALRRIIPGSMTFDRDGRDVGYLEVARRALERRRARLGREGP